MATPMSAYREAAKKFGNIDPTDDAAVNEFFRVGFHKLPKLRQHAIMAFLASRDGAAGQQPSPQALFFSAPATSFAPAAQAYDALFARRPRKAKHRVGRALKSKETARSRRP